MIPILAPLYEEKRKYRRLSDFDMAVIYERSALRQSVVLLGAAPAKLEWSVNSKEPLRPQQSSPHDTHDVTGGPCKSPARALDTQKTLLEE